MTAGGLVRLLRPPNVWTAIADSAAGMLVAGAATDPMVAAGAPAHAMAGTGAWAPAVLGASACLYLAGIALNDFFDREVDARERPGRPVPSGQVSPAAAAALGFGLLAAGVALARSAGSAPGWVGLAVAVAVLLYDAGLKRTPLGPLVMGSCRALNFLLGSAVWGIPPWPDGRWAGPAFLGAYVVVVTFVARDEVVGNSRRRARIGLVALAVLAVVALGLLARSGALWPAWVWVVGLLGLEGRNWAPLWRDAGAARTGRAIGGAILLIPGLDAAVVAAAGRPLQAAGVAALMLPAVALRRWYSPT